MSSVEWQSCKRIAKKIFLLCTPLIVFSLLELFVFPEDLFTFRVWDAISISGRNAVLSGSFYPNRKFERMEQGDLAAYSKDAVYRSTVWETDVFGFRNSNHGCRDYPIVIVGDSFAVGTGLTQADTLSEVLSRKLKTCVYSFSSLELNDYLTSSLWRRSKPSVVLYVKSEWWIKNESDLPLESKNLHGEDIVRRLGVGDHSLMQSIAVFRDRYGKSIMLRTYRKRGPLFVFSQIIGWFTNNAFSSQAYGNSNTEQKEMHFRSMVLTQDPVNQAEVDFVAKRMAAFRDEFSRHGVRFVFMPVPNKETIYLPGLHKRGELLDQIFLRMTQLGVETIQLQPAFLSHQASSPELLYQTDDTHWNEKGVRLSADLVSKALH